MPLITTGATQTAIAGNDSFLLGDSTTTTQTGNDGNDLIIGAYGTIWSDSDHISNSTAATALNLSADSSRWYTAPNPLIDDALQGTPWTSVHITGDDTEEYFAVSVGVGQTLTIDVDWADFDTEVEIFRLVNGTLTAVTNGRSDDGSEPDGQDQNNPTYSSAQRDSYLSFTADAVTAGQLIVLVSDLSSQTVLTGSEALVHFSVTGQAATGAASDFTSGNDDLRGNAGDDHLYGLDGNDTLRGGLGNDYLDGGDGTDSANYYFINADVTVDLSVSGAQNTIGAGTDTLVNFENIDGSNTGNDTLTGDDQANGIIGWGGNDTIFGNGGDDRIEGRAGQDILSGGDGNDRFIFYNGELVAGEELYGGDETADTGTEDEIFLSGNSSSIFDFTVVTVEGFEELSLGTQFGGGSTAVFTGDQWNNDNAITTITSGARNAANGFDLVINLASETSLDLSGVSFNANWDDSRDTITINGSSGADTLVAATDQATIINGGGGVDIITGGSGDDIINGGLFSDTINAGGGNDRIIMASGDVFDTVDGGAGDNDVIDFTTYVGLDLVINLGSGQYVGFSQAVRTVENVEDVYGSNQSDNITGDDGVNVLNGNGGDDTIEGGAGADTLDGGAGVNTLSYANSNGGVDVSLLFDTASSAFGVGVTHATGDTLVSDTFQNITGSAFDDDLDGDAGVNVITAGAGNDEIDGQAGADRIFGQAGDDQIEVEVGGAVAGAEYDGGADNDELVVITFNTNGTYDFRDSTVSNFETFTFNDFWGGGNTVRFNAAQFTFTTLKVGFEKADGNSLEIYMDDQIALDLSALILTGGWNDDDSIDIFGDNDIETITGSAGDDTINAGGGADTIDGGAGVNILSYAGSDAISINLETGIHTGGDAAGDMISNISLIKGSFNDDSFIGSTGDDLLDGEAGNDTLIGGAGRDTLGGGVGNDTFRVFDGDIAAGEIYLGGDDDGGVGDTFKLTGDGDSVFDLRVIDAITGMETLEFDQSLGGGESLLITGSQFTFENVNVTGASTTNVDLQIFADGDLNLSGVTFTGWDSDDTITISGNDSLGQTFAGGAQDEVFLVSGGTNSYSGGGGNDTLDASAVTSDIVAGEGGGNITYDGVASFVNSSIENFILGSGNDQLNLGNLSTGDVVDGGAGINTLLINSSSNGNVADLSAGTFAGSSGSSTADDLISNFQNVIGGIGNDTIIGDSGNNVIEGGLGADTLSGGDGVDTLSYASATEDVVVDLTGSQTAVSNGVTDTISGFESFIGGAGNDTVTTAGAFDGRRLEGGDGNDTFNITGNALINVHGDDGMDLLDVSQYSWGGVNANLATGTYDDLGLSGFTLEGIENFNGTNFGDEIIGSDADNILNGNGGADTITGGLGADTIDGGAGDDIIYADSADDFANIQGGADDDTLYLASNNYVTHDFLANGFETAFVQNAAGQTLQIFTTLANGNTRLQTLDPNGTQAYSLILTETDLSDSFVDWQVRTQYRNDNNQNYQIDYVLEDGTTQEVRIDLDNSQSYQTLTINRNLAGDLDTVIALQDGGRRVTTDYDPDDSEVYSLSIQTEDLADNDLFDTVLQLRNDAGQVYNIINTYDNALVVDVEFDVENDDPYFRKVINTDGSADGNLLNYVTATFYQRSATETYQLDVIGDDDVRAITNFDLDNVEAWATERTRTDDGDNFSWGTIVEQRTATNQTLFASQTNEGGYDTTDEFDLFNTQVWARRLTYTDDEDLFAWDTITFLYDDTGTVYDQTTVPDM